MPRFLLLVLLFLCVTSCTTFSAPTPTPTPSAVEKIDVLIDTIYTASGAEKNWEEITEEGLDIETITAPGEPTYKVSLGENMVIIEHVPTKQLETMQVDDIGYSIVPLLYKTDKGLGWSGLMLVKCEDGKYYLERSLTAMTDEQLEKVVKELQELFNSLQDIGNA